MVGINSPHSEKQRIRQGARVSIHAIPDLYDTAGDSAAVALLPTVNESAQEVPYSDPDLRREFEHLRREFERMRQIQEMTQEAPPLYEDEARVDI